MQFIALFFPSVLGCVYFNKMELNKEGIVRYLYTYIVFVLCTNIFTMFTVTYVLGVDGVVSEALESFSFFMIYTVMACFFSTVGAKIAKIVMKNLDRWN